MSSTSHEAAKAVPGTWAPGEEGGVGGPHRHAFRPEAPPDTALQRPEQELLCHTDPPSGQQCDRVHAVGGEHRAGVPGGGGPEAGVAGGKSVCAGGRGCLSQSSLRGSAPALGTCLAFQPQPPGCRRILLSVAWARSHSFCASGGLPRGLL